MGLGRLARIAGCFVVCALSMAALLMGSSASALADGAPAITVSGNQLEANSVPGFQLRGVNTNAYASCGNPYVSSQQTFYDTTWESDNDEYDDFADGPVNQWSIDVMKSWGINSVRLAVNESCWLGEPSTANDTNVWALPNVCAAYADTCETAQTYQQNVEKYVDLLTQNGLAVVIELQATAPAGYPATEIDYFPDATNAPIFWEGVANHFAHYSNVLFDLSGEWAAGPDPKGPNYASGPNSGQNWSNDDIWRCWLEGCSSPSLYGGTYPAQGVQGLITDIRKIGADNAIVLGTPDYTLGYDEDCGAQDDQPCWSVYQPSDPAPSDPSSNPQLVYDVHVYDFDFDNGVPTDPSTGDADPDDQEEADRFTAASDYLHANVVPVARMYPVMLGELGESTCQSETDPFVPNVLGDIDSFNEQNDPETGAPLDVSVFGWTWDANDDNGDQIATGWHCPTGEYGAGGPILINDYDGDPTKMGQVFENWFQAEDKVEGISYPKAPGAPNSGSSGSSTPTQPSTPPASSGASSGGSAGGTTPSTPPSSGSGGGSSSPGQNVSTDTAKPPAAVSRVPHIAASGANLTCTGASFAATVTGTTSFYWYDAQTGRKIAGPQKVATLASRKVYDRPVFCITDKGGTQARSVMFAVPGQVSSARTGRAQLPVICPSSSRVNCTVQLTLTAGAKTIGAKRISLKPGRGSVASVTLTTAGRRLLKRSKKLAATLVVAETVAGVKQTVAQAKLTFRS